MTTETKELNRERTYAGNIPFSPYAQFMNATRGLLYIDNVTKKHYTRLQVWLREMKNKSEIERLKLHNSSKYKSYDKEGWKNGRWLFEPK